MNPSGEQVFIPDITLIIGTDASGKDHVADIVEQMIGEAGYAVEKRKSFLSGKTTRDVSSTDKHSLQLLSEKMFIWLYPFIGFLLPSLLNLLLKMDLKKLKRSDKKVIVVSHNCLRLLAFHWGNRYADTAQIPLSASVQTTLADMRSVTGLHTLILDVDDYVRKERIHKRSAQGESDYFDRYMAEDGKRSERIEEILVWLSQHHLDGVLIENNDLSDRELRQRIAASFAAKEQ